MVVFFAIVATVNLALGYFLAIYLGHARAATSAPTGPAIESLAPPEPSAEDLEGMLDQDEQSWNAAVEPEASRIDSGAMDAPPDVVAPTDLVPVEQAAAPLPNAADLASSPQPATTVAEATDSATVEARSGEPTLPAPTATPNASRPAGDDVLNDKSDDESDDESDVLAGIESFRAQLEQSGTGAFETDAPWRPTPSVETTSEGAIAAGDEGEGVDSEVLAGIKAFRAQLAQMQGGSLQGGSPQGVTPSAAGDPSRKVIAAAKH